MTGDEKVLTSGEKHNIVAVMQAEATMSVTKMHAFLHCIEESGSRKEDILKAAGVDARVLQSPDRRLGSGEIKRIMQAAVRATNDENIGLRQGARLSKGFSSIVGYILMNCRTLGEAAEKFREYERIVDETGRAQIVRRGDRTVLGYKTVDAALADCRTLSDFKVSGMLSYITMLTGKRIALKAVHFSHPRPEDVSGYRRVFRCPVFFNETMNALVFDRRLTTLPVIEPNSGLLPLFERKAREIMAACNADETWTGKVSRVILREMRGALPSIGAVAKDLAMSVRSLQLALKREGASFTKLIGELRKEAAISYLTEKKASIGEIAYLLGFSEASSFHRAFRKWTNTTPGEFRSGRNVGSAR